LNTTEILDKVKKTIEERGKTSGSIEENHRRIAGVFSWFLSTRFDWEIYLTPSDIATMMVLFKIARSTWGKKNLDDGLDMVGYSAIFTELEYPE